MRIWSRGETGPNATNCSTLRRYKPCRLTHFYMELRYENVRTHWDCATASNEVPVVTYMSDSRWNVMLSPACRSRVRDSIQCNSCNSYNQASESNLNNLIHGSDKFAKESFQITADHFVTRNSFGREEESHAPHHSADRANTTESEPSPQRCMQPCMHPAQRCTQG